MPGLTDGYQTRNVSVELNRVAASGFQVLSGLGGVGKTQLAAAYAQQTWSSRTVDLLLWVTATTRQAVIAEYAQAAADVLAADGGDAEHAAARFLGWLARTDKRWLIVLDDVTAPADLTGLWPPATRFGTVLVTTRRRDAALTGRGRRLIDVGLFTPDEATAYLHHKLPDQPPEQLAWLAADLGCLPLALAQAAAYMTDRGLTCADYRRRLTDRQRTLAQLFPEPTALPDEHRTAVEATWSLSVEAADMLHPRGLARPVLDLVALLDSNGVPTDLFTTAPAVNYLATNRTASVTEPTDVDAAADAVHNLHRLNLITIDAAARDLRVHALVQRATRDRLTPARLHATTQATADALMEIWPELERNPAVGRALRANATALRQHVGDALLTPKAHTVLFRIGQSLGDAGQVTAAVNHFAQLLTDCLRVLGPDHPDTLAARSNLAWQLREAGDAAGAARTAEELLADRLRVLGADHPDTLTTRNTLAYCRGEAGDPAGAAAAFEQLLGDRTRVLGPDHPDTLHTRANLAWWRGEAGDPARAAQATEALLADRLRLFGPDHPDTLASRSNLARWRGEAGDPAGAATAFEQLLGDELRVLGPHHPDTLHTRSSLTWWQGEVVNPAAAVTAYEELLIDCLSVVGPDHPTTLTIRGNLARSRGKAGDVTGAAAAFEELLTDCIEVLGSNHLTTLTVRSDLARWQADASN